MTGRRICLFALVLAACLAAPTATAAAPGPGSYKVKRLRTISGPTPFAAGCPGAFHDEAKIDGLVIEPAIAANPTDPRNIVATWKQDVSPEFNARDDVVAWSKNGGNTWRRTAVPGLTRCTGGTSDAASDPWVSFGADGTAYFGGQSGLVSTDPPDIAIVASRSGDGGRHWAFPTTVAPRAPFNEQPGVTGDPTRRGHAYMAWANFPPPNAVPPPWNNTISFSRTTDGGRTWSAPIVIDQPGLFGLDFAPRIRVLPNGTLLAMFVNADAALGLASLRIARSLDGGVTWQPSVPAVEKPLPGEIVDPETGEELPQPGINSSAVAPDGTAYFAFEDSPSPPAGAIGVVRSLDGGQTWSTIILPGVSAFAFEPAIAVDRHGVVGVIWYDLRNDRVGDAETTADLWFAYSTDRGATWRQLHVAGPTDIRTGAPPAQNRFGEYQGLAGLDRGFAAAFGLASPLAKNGPTDIFFAEIGPRNSNHQGDDDGDDQR